MPDTEVYGELVGRDVVVGNVHAVICDYNRFNRPPFTWKYAVDGEEGFGWRENFYVLPTREQIAEAWFNRDPHNFGPKTWTDAPEWMRKTPYAIADSMLALLNGASDGA